MLSRRILFPFLAVAVLSCGCCRNRPKDEGPPPQPMKIGESRLFQFPVDGEWHRSDVQVLNDDLLLIEPQGMTAGLGTGALQCRADGPPLYVDGKESIRFRGFAPLEFMVVTTKAKDFPGMAEAKITKRDGRR
ncbi:MAG: hypothetical protein NTW86_12925 [Candidatus Sumerlaeota bacterium]|nr:hypothetical protein [Candidatus Sumerlaeota bacterium]